MEDMTDDEKWNACLREGWSFTDETVEQVVARFVKITGWTELAVQQRLTSELILRGETLNAARKAYHPRST